MLAAMYPVPPEVEWIADTVHFADPETSWLGDIEADEPDVLLWGVFVLEAALQVGEVGIADPAFSAEVNYDEILDAADTLLQRFGSSSAWMLKLARDRIIGTLH
jgi:hypothetical protein